MIVDLFSIFITAVSFFVSYFVGFIVVFVGMSLIGSFFKK